MARREEANMTQLNKKRDSDLIRFRDTIRVFFIITFFGLGITTEAIIGKEIEFESEYVVLLSMFIFGSFFCGWACPFGNLSYFISKLGQERLSKYQFQLPEKWDQPLRYFKILMLVGFIWVFAAHGTSYFDDHGEMYKTTLFSYGYFIAKMVSVFLLSLVLGPFYCRYLCYQKAAYNLLNKFSLTHISRDADKCVDCRKCDNVCPMTISISSMSKIRGADCLSCYNCLDKKKCPEGAMKIRFLGKSFEVTGFVVAALCLYVILTFFALIYLPVG